MNVWYHLSTIFRQRHALRIAGLIMICVVLITTLFFASVTQAAPGINQTISFQGRLLGASGDVVTDGHYNIQFKIYQDGSGTAEGNPDGTLKWTETYLNNGGTNGVSVKNGYFSVNLGSVNPFGSSIDWNQDTLWLSMNVAGSDASCSTFGTAPCVADGEMLPMKRLTTSPYAMNSGLLQGKTASNFIQLAQGVQTDASTNTSSIFINKTGTGNLVQLQNAATDVFTVSNSGSLTLGSNSDKTISIGTTATNTAGRNLTVSAGGGGGGAGSSGGDLVLQGGAAGGTNGSGGDVSIDAGAGTGSGTGGIISIGTTNASSIRIGGSSDVIIGNNNARFVGGGETLYVGNADENGEATTANGFTIQGTSSTAANAQGGALAIQSGSATNGDANGGNLTLTAGSGSGTGATGLVVINTPTFQTATQQDCGVNCAISQASIDGNGAVLVSATDANLTMTMNDPTITTAGRIVYVMAAGASNDFVLSINGGGVNNQITMKANATATLIWNGSDWSSAGASGYSTLQSAYQNSVNNGETPGVTVGENGFNINEDAENPTTSGLLNVKDANDNSIFTVNSDGTVSNVRVGDGAGTTSLLTVDQGSEAPSIDGDAWLGSMYYDTTIGKLQCYEADGWGACSSSPDNFVSLSPEYANAVMNGTGAGTMTADLCSDALDINDGTSGPTVCGTDETYNFYNWTSSELDPETNNIFVTYQLPSTFKEFVAGSTSLMARTDSADAAVSYQIYRNTANGLTACGTVVAASSGVQTTWQEANADPSSCTFQPGDSVVFKITLSAANDANAYVSNLNFAFSNR